MFLLDTDHCVYYLNDEPREVKERLLRIGPAHVAISCFTVAELVYGAHKSRQKEANLAKIERLCDKLVVLPFEDSVARVFGELKAALWAAGQLNAGTAHLGRVKRDFDVGIAATALVYGRILVTHNKAHFAGMSGRR